MRIVKAGILDDINVLNSVKPGAELFAPERVSWVAAVAGEEGQVRTNIHYPEDWSLTHPSSRLCHQHKFSSHSRQTSSQSLQSKVVWGRDSPFAIFVRRVRQWVGSDSQTSFLRKFMSQATEYLIQSNVQKI